MSDGADEAKLCAIGLIARAISVLERVDYDARAIAATLATAITAYVIVGGASPASEDELIAHVVAVMQRGFANRVGAEIEIERARERLG